MLLIIFEITLRLALGSRKPDVLSLKNVSKLLRPKTLFFICFNFLHSAHKRSYDFLTNYVLYLSTYFVNTRIKNFGKFAFLFIGFKVFRFAFIFSILFFAAGLSTFYNGTFFYWFLNSNFLLFVVVFESSNYYFFCMFSWGLLKAAGLILPWTYADKILHKSFWLICWISKIFLVYALSWNLISESNLTSLLLSFFYSKHKKAALS